MIEKLVELMAKADQHRDEICVGHGCERCAYEPYDECGNQIKAEYLIANGVRLEEKQATSNASEQFASDNHVGGKWIPVTERLPREEDADEHDCVLVHTSNRDNLIVAREAVWKCTEFMTHWQPLHEPPKGE